MEYWSNNILFKIASLISKPIKVDDHSFNWERGRFVRICIEIDFTKPIKQDVWIGKPNVGLFQAVKYERVPYFCFKCSMIGHRVNECSIVIANDLMNLDINRHDYAINVSTISNADKNVINASADCSKTLYGPWVRDTCKPRNKSFLKQSLPPDKGDLHDNLNLLLIINFLLNDDPDDIHNVENAETTYGSILFGRDSVKTPNNVPSAPFTFNTLVDKISPKILKIKDNPNLKPNTKPSKDKRKSSKVFFGKGKSPKSRLEEGSLVLDILHHSKKKRVRKDSSTLLDTNVAFLILVWLLFLNLFPILMISLLLIMSLFMMFLDLISIINCSDFYLFAS
ncbi:hypothetical protein Cni_G22519 [Canna indica]|uniref:Zinc knuckle CX2CX4HX4C domain-containing protein n=1 Tax=Canna indica TaxID=4628 RepID=A0AAQ3QLP8_9LILI|nr:hypothetical protein Cni_G22519 [Canna indica]